MAKNNKNEYFYSIFESKWFDSLNDEVKGMVIRDFKKLLDEEAKTGIVGRLFGNRIEKTPSYIAFIIAILLIIVGIIYILLPPTYKQTTDLEFWQHIETIIGSALGYIFGSSSSKL